MLGNKRWMTTLGALLTLGLLGTTPAQAIGIGVSDTLEGCKITTGVTLPNGDGDFICPDANYTTGNLGKLWAELDLVPYRITLKAGNSAPASQTYTLAVVLDGKDDGHPGYDVISAPVLNEGLSDGTCDSDLNPSNQLVKDPGVGGIDLSIYRLITVTQAKNTTCVYDYYGRLAVGSHEFPGSSLHANLLNGTLGTGGIGASDVSIPVREIAPQEISKEMSASVGSDYAWGISKESGDAIDFGDVCRDEAESRSLPVQIKVAWTKVAVASDKVAVTIVLSAHNPAARTIKVQLTDNLYQADDNGDPIGEPFFTSTVSDVPEMTIEANKTATATLIKEFATSVAGNVGDWLYNEVSGTYIDEATEIPVPGQTTANTKAQIQQAAATTNTSVSITDVEDITGDGLSYAVATPSVGTLLAPYSANTPTSGEVGWSTNQTTAGSVTFNKMVYLDNPKRVTEGSLADTATLTTSGGVESSFPLAIDIMSSAQVALTIEKSIPDFLDTGETLEVEFLITHTDDPNNPDDGPFSETKVITFSAGETTDSVTIPGLDPVLYVVEEKGNTLFKPGISQGQSVNLVDTREDHPNPRSVDLSLVNGIARCSTTVDFENSPGTGFAKAQVQKTTVPTLESDDPDYEWSFRLHGPDNVELSTQTVGAGADPGKFQGTSGDLLLTAEGTYTVLETEKEGWDLISANPDSEPNKVCDFTVDYPEDIGTTFSCLFVNHEQPGVAKVVKTVNGSSDLGNYTFTFVLRKGASQTEPGEILETMTASAQNGGILDFETKLVPGDTYQMCETVMPGWNSSLGGFVPGASPDNSTTCVDFTVARGETHEISVDNSPPPGGLARTIGFWRNWASCSRSNGKQDPVLDQTLGSDGVLLGKLLLKIDPIAQVNNCQQAVRILSKQDVNTGKQMSSSPAYNMAAQLLAAMLNVKAGAGACLAAETAINAAQNLLDGPPPNYAVNFTGTGDSYPKKGQFATEANSLATTLDRYNNNLLCTGP